MQTQFHVSHIGQDFGPWSLEEIVMRMAQMELLATDFLYDEAKGEWIALADHAPLMEMVRARKPSAPPSGVRKSPTMQPSNLQVASVEVQPVASAQPEFQWFVQKQTHRFGPLNFAGVIQGLQDKTIFEYDFIWHEGMDKWTRIAEHSDFAQDKVRALYESSSLKGFVQRRHPRLTYMNEVMVHDDRRLWVGQTFQASAGGTGILLENPGFTLGQVVKLHFASHDGLAAFNVSAEIVNKRFIKENKGKRTAVPYGVKFMEMNDELLNQIENYFLDKKLLKSA
jgi:hypothetical protein